MNKWCLGEALHLQIARELASHRFQRTITVIHQFPLDILVPQYEEDLWGLDSKLHSKTEGTLQTVASAGGNITSTWRLVSWESSCLPTPLTKKLSKHEILKLSMKYISFLSGVLKGMDSNQAEICSDCVMDPSKCSPSSSSATSSNDGVLSARLDLEHVSVDSLTSQIRLEEEGDWIPGNLYWNGAIRHRLQVRWEKTAVEWSIQGGKNDFSETWEFARIPEEQTMSHWHTETRVLYRLYVC